jgi:cystathionine beta-lyase
VAAPVARRCLFTLAGNGKARDIDGEHPRVPDSQDLHIDTQLALLGRPKRSARGAVNVAVQRASTILFSSLDELERASSRKYEPSELYYGTMGTQTTHAFEEAMAALDGGHAAIGVSSGLAACTSAILAFVRGGDHVLVTDSVYDPTRAFCDGMLSGLGVETTYYDPTIGAGIAELIRPNTKVVFLETPGSHTFDVQDVPAICRVARERGVVSVIDNTWATPMYFRPLDHGANVVVYAATKYMCGHADVLVGAVVADKAHYHKVRVAIAALGHSLSPDDAYLTLRGLRTMGVRLERQQRGAIELALWLETHPDVRRVLHPALPSHPGHAIWKRDFLGASGLFAFVLPPARREALAAFFDHLRVFGMGYSWGGFESLILPGTPSEKRSVARWDDKQGTLIRVSVGLEDVRDLQHDLSAALQRWKAVIV